MSWFDKIIIAASLVLAGHAQAHGRVKHHVVRHVRYHHAGRSGPAPYCPAPLPGVLCEHESGRAIDQPHANAPRQDGSNSSYWQGESARGPVEAIGGDLVATARRFLGSGRPHGAPAEWCGAFMGLVARVTGHAVPAGYEKAAQWIHAGPRLPGPRVGAIAVYSHHVGIVEAVTKQGPLLISGNFGHKVAEGYQRRGRLLGYVALAGRG